MPEMYRPTHSSIGGLLDMDSTPIRVPDWQRNYTWTRSEPGSYESFFDDVLQFRQRYPGENIDDKEYFLGSIVLVDRGDHLELLDGQQRLATASLLLSVIREFMTVYNAQRADAFNHKYIVDEDPIDGTKLYRLELNRYDGEFFRRELEQTGIEPVAAPRASRSSHKLIRAARNYFITRVGGELDSIGPGARRVPVGLGFREGGNSTCVGHLIR